MIERWTSPIRTHIARKAVCLMHWDIQCIATIIFNRKVFAFVTIHAPLNETGESPDSMIDMDDEITCLQIRVDRFRSLCNLLLPNARLWPLPTKDLGISN